MQDPSLRRKSGFAQDDIVFTPLICHPEQSASECEHESKDPLHLFVTTGSARNSLISILRIPFPAVAGSCGHAVLRLRVFRASRRTRSAQDDIHSFTRRHSEAPRLHQRGEGSCVEYHGTTGDARKILRSAGKTTALGMTSLPKSNSVTTLFPPPVQPCRDATQNRCG